jgi:hypothetical protein
MTSRCLVGVGVLLVASSAWAQTAAEHVDAARKLVADSKFKEAMVELDTLAHLPNNERPVVVALYELSGYALAGLKQAPKSKAAFQKLLVLEPNFKLPAKVNPKTVAAIFKDAKRTIAQAGGGGLKAEQLTPEIKAGKVTGVYVSVENDPAGIAKTVRMHQKLDGGPWVVKEVPALPTTPVEAGGKLVQWWLEVLGENGAVLFVLGSEADWLFDAVPGTTPPAKTAVAAAPKKDEVKKDEVKKDEPKKVEPKKDAPVADAKPNLTPAPKETPPEIVTKSEPLKAPGPLSLIIAGTGVASAGVGAAFGALSAAARHQVTNPSVDPATGYVTSINRSEALALEKQSQTDAVVANTLIGVGAGLVVGGVVAWILGGK